MCDSPYEHDALGWAEEQSALLRRLAAGEGVNAAVDWPHVIEEVRDVGLSELRACQSLLQQALVHLLKLHAWPHDPSTSHWRDEAGAFLDDAQRRFAPTMPQRIDLASLYGRALRRAADMIEDAGAGRPRPEHCPFTLDALLDCDVRRLVETLGGDE